MACVIKGNAVKNVMTRTFAAQAAALTKEKSHVLTRHHPEVSTLSNGAIVASLENNAPVSNIAILFKSGPRYETSENFGVSHMLRLCAGMATKNFSAFGLTRRTQQMGGTVTCETGREHILYGMDMIRDNVSDGCQMLAAIATQPSFKPWEISDGKLRLLTDLGVREPLALVMDNLHKAAFRNSGLGNSLYVPSYRVGKVTPEEIYAFFKSTHSSERMSVVGLGVGHTDLVRFAKKVIEIDSGVGGAGSGSYGGGEIREQTGSPLAYIALAGPGTSLGSAEAASFAVAQSILGTWPGTKHGSNSSSKLAAAITSAGGSGCASAINVNYSDAGLFGFFLVEEEAKAGDVVRSIVKTIKSLKVSEPDIQQAKVRAKAALVMGSESSGAEVEDMGLQSLFLGSYSSPSEYSAAIDKVTATSVQNAFANMLKGKPSLSAYGGISRLPYLDQI